MLQVPVLTGEKLAELFGEADCAAVDKNTRDLARRACEFFETDGFFDSLEDYDSKMSDLYMPCATNVKEFDMGLSIQICDCLLTLDRSIRLQARLIQ